MTHEKPAADKDALKPVRQSIKLMDEMVALMAEEETVLNSHDYAKHRELLKKKQRMTLDYRANIKLLSGQPELMKNLPTDMRIAIKKNGQKMSDMAEKNARLLRSAMLGTQNLLQNIITVVKDEALPKQGYSNTQDAATKLGTYSPTCPPVTGSRTA